MSVNSLKLQQKQAPATSPTSKPWLRSLLRRRIETYARLIISARNVLTSKAHMLETANSLLDSGKGTIGAVYQARDELNQARRIELNSMLRYRESLVQLTFIQGALLAKWDLERTSDGRVLLSSLLVRR